jgi:hypothetical protein
MYIGQMRPLRPHRRSCNLRVSWFAALNVWMAAGMALVLSGCLFDSPSSGKTVPRPSTFNPEEDAFRSATSRQYTWLEELEFADQQDTVLSMGSFELRHTRDTLLAGETRPFFDVSASFTVNAPAPGSLLARAGFRASRVHFDSLRMPDPGPSYRFPDTPSAGWRLDTTVGDVRFVRRLKGAETISQYGVRHETWAFAESTWWQGDAPVLLGTGTSWMGRTGLVKHLSRWPGYVSAFGAGTLRRSLMAP